MWAEGTLPINFDPEGCNDPLMVDMGPPFVQDQVPLAAKDAT